MWVQLKTAKYVERNGKLHKFPAGERINVGRTTAMEWVAAGDAIIVKAIVKQAVGKAGFVVTDLQRASDVIRSVSPDSPIVTGLARCEFALTCIWDTSANVRPDLFQVGFNLLAHWQVAAPLWSYTELACHVGSDADRAATKAAIRELRVPLYDARVLFVRRCDDTRRLIDMWVSERQGGGDARLAFLRAMYQIKPVLCALPVQWTGKVA